MTLMHRYRGGTGHLSRPTMWRKSRRRSGGSCGIGADAVTFLKSLSGWCTVFSMLLCSSALQADVQIPDDLLGESTGVGGAAAGVDDGGAHHAHHPTAINECGGRCSCLGEYMDCANVHMVRFEERLPSWITTL